MKVRRWEEYDEGTTKKLLGDLVQHSEIILSDADIHAILSGAGVEYKALTGLGTRVNMKIRAEGTER